MSRGVQFWVLGGGTTVTDLAAPIFQTHQNENVNQSHRRSTSDIHAVMPRSITSTPQGPLPTKLKCDSQAAPQLFRAESGIPIDRTFGTPGSPNQILEFAAVAPRCAESQPHRRKAEQTALDRLPPRRGEAVLDRHANRLQSGLIVDQQRDPLPSKPVQRAKARPRLDEALRATDLLLQAGGFGAIVLDMSDMRPEQILRIPIAS